MNKIFLIGRLTKDPDLRYTQSNIAVASFSLAVDRRTKEDGTKETDFINIVVWQKQAENVNKYIKKGSLVAIHGRLQTRTYDDKDGKKVYVSEVVAENVQFLDLKKAEDKVEEKQDLDKQYEDFGNSVELTDEDIDSELAF
jgi:single-strand DNA-binding protein